MLAMVTYFFSKIFVKYDHFSNQAHFFILLFLAQELKKISAILLFIVTTETL
jgi:hypothetical protein